MDEVYNRTLETPIFWYSDFSFCLSMIKISRITYLKSISMSLGNCLTETRFYQWKFISTLLPLFPEYTGSSYEPLPSFCDLFVTITRSPEPFENTCTR